jgi:type IV pilus assembly protein PilQ
MIKKITLICCLVAIIGVGPALSQTKESPYQYKYVPSQRLINLSLIDTDIRDALSALAMEQEINIATAKEVTGKISIHLYQVTLEKALHAITLAGGFSYHKHGDVYYVYKPKLAKDPQTDRLQTRIFKLKYADISKVKDILSTFPGIRTIKFHEPSKTIFLEDTPETIKKIETIIAHWDTVPKQVMIEAKILVSVRRFYLKARISLRYRKRARVFFSTS